MEFPERDEGLPLFEGKVPGQESPEWTSEVAMCGIAGIYNGSISDEVAGRIVEKLGHRGPDASGISRLQGATLIHTRLSILELSDLGAQPYKFENLTMVYNGEIYNFKEVREGLIRKGYSFNSNSDTEVLIKAFHCYREACVDHLNGMFAFAVYDSSVHSISLFRDRLGVKPLYYAWVNGALAFASELKTLLEFGPERKIDSQAVVQYFRFGFIPGAQSIYSSVRKLPSAHYMVAKREGVDLRRYWKPAEGPATSPRELEETMISAFRYRMVSDVPVGVFLSGGIDSSLLTALLRKHHGQVRTFTIGFHEKKFDESAYAAKVAAQLGTDHTSMVLERSTAEGFLDAFYDIYDEPFSDTSGIPTSLVAQLAKSHGVRVVLSADGGDELFGGYDRYVNIPALHKRFQAPLLRQVASWGVTRRLIPQSVRQHIYPGNFEHRVSTVEDLAQASSFLAFYESAVANQASSELKQLLNDTDVPVGPLFTSDSSLQQQMMDWDREVYLPDDLLVKVDRATMHHGIECREPFLDFRLVELARRLPADQKIRGNETKVILRTLLQRYLPGYDFARPKQGFSIPLFQWFSDKLDERFQYYLAPGQIDQTGLLNSKTVTRELNKYRYYKKYGKEYNIEKLWRLASFMMWWEKYM
jgi:asparagine synthase (glutamine-hydrolysing)